LIAAVLAASPSTPPWSPIRPETLSELRESSGGSDWSAKPLLPRNESSRNSVLRYATPSHRKPLTRTS
jgi:hypothetical protein